jgi:hypothetical protein
MMSFSRGGGAYLERVQQLVPAEGLGMPPNFLIFPRERGIKGAESGSVRERCKVERAEQSDGREDASLAHLGTLNVSGWRSQAGQPLGIGHTVVGQFPEGHGGPPHGQEERQAHVRRKLAHIDGSLK